MRQYASLILSGISLFASAYAQPVWTSRASGLTDTLRGVEWAGNQWFAMGKQGGLATSPDGIVWTSRESGVGTELRDVAYGGGKYALVGGYYELNSWNLLDSRDGIDWHKSERERDPSWLGPTSMLTAVIWTGTRFLATGYYQQLLTSADGAKWTEIDLFIPISDPTFFYDLEILGANAAGNRYLLTGWNGKVMVSKDGDDWQGKYTKTSQGLNAAAWMGNQVVVVGDSGAVQTSPDGGTWTSRESGTRENLRGLVWTGKSLVALGVDGTVLVSTDGIAWAKSAIFGGKLFWGLGYRPPVAGIGMGLLAAVGADGKLFTAPMEGDAASLRPRSEPPAGRDLRGGRMSGPQVAFGPEESPRRADGALLRLRQR